MQYNESEKHSDRKFLLEKTFLGMEFSLMSEQLKKTVKKAQMLFCSEWILGSLESHRKRELKEFELRVGIW